MSTRQDGDDEACRKCVSGSQRLSGMRPKVRDHVVGVESPQGAESMNTVYGWKHDLPIFCVKLHGKECNVLFDTGSSANILDMEKVFMYIDDIILFSKDITPHFKMLEEVLCRLGCADHKIKVRNCQFLMRSLEYLRHMVTTEGIKMQAGKIKSICEYSLSYNVKVVRRLLGMAGYYRPFI